MGKLDKHAHSPLACQYASLLAVNKNEDEVLLMYALSSVLGKHDHKFTLHTDDLLSHTVYSLAACNSAINGIQRIKLSQLC